MSLDTNRLLARFHHVLVGEIRDRRPELLSAPFTVAEIYQELVPYGTHRDRLGLEMNGDYEDLLLRLLAGEGGYLLMDSEAARGELQAELRGGDPNTAIFRDYAAADVRLNPGRIDESGIGLTIAVETEPGTWVEVPEEPLITMDQLAPAVDEVVEEAVEEVFEEVVEGVVEVADEVRYAEEERDDLDASVPEDPPTPSEPGGAPETCHWCRAELPDRENLNYCPFCGTDVNLVPCPGCGEELEPNWRFCIACGAEVQAD